MGLVDPGAYRNREEVWRDRFESRRRVQIMDLLTDDVIEEHARNPLGYRDFHSPVLQMVLNYFRTQAILGKYAVYASRPWEEYKIAVITERGEVATVLDTPTYRSEEEAMHGVFTRRVADLRRGVGGAGGPG
jgi:hypothetical protein